MKKHFTTIAIACAALFSLASCTKSPCDAMADSLEEMVNVCCQSDVTPNKAIATIKAATAAVKSATEYAKTNPGAAKDDIQAFHSSERFRTMTTRSKKFGHAFEMLRRMNPEVQAANEELDEALLELSKACK